MTSVSAPTRRVSTIVKASDVMVDENVDVLQKYTKFKNQKKGHDPAEAKRKSMCNKLRRNCHFAAFKGDLGYVRKALTEVPSLINDNFDYMEQPLMSPVEENDLFYLPPAQVPKLVRAALAVGNPAHMTLDQRWLLTHSFARCSLLHYACAGDQIIVVRYLIEEGADRNCTNLANREPDYYTMDERVREFLWTSPTHYPKTVEKQTRPKRLSIFNGGGAVAAVETQIASVEDPLPVYAVPTEYVLPSETQVQAHQPTSRPPPQHCPSQISNAMSSLFTISVETSTPAPPVVIRAPPPPPGPGAHRGAPPPPPPPPSTTLTVATVSNIPAPVPPRALPPPPPAGRNPSIMMLSAPPPAVGTVRTSSISQLIERTRKSIRIEEEVASLALNGLNNTMPFSSAPRPSVAEAKPRLSISKRRLSRVIQSRKHRDSRTGQESDEETKEVEIKEIPMLDLVSPHSSFSRPLVMKRLSVQADGSGLRETIFRVDEEGELTECTQPSLVLGDDDTDDVNSTVRPAVSRGVLSKSNVSLREVEESVQYLEAWEGKVAARDGSSDHGGDTLSIIKAAMYDPSNGLEGARAAASLFARAKKVEREEAHNARKRQSVMRIYQKMPPMESVAAQMIRQHSSGLSAMQILFKNSANNDQSVLDTYQTTLDNALHESVSGGDTDDDEWSGSGHTNPSAVRKKRKPVVDMTKLSYREMIWCKAGMGMNISDASVNVSEDARLRTSAYKQGVRIMKKEFRSYAFRDNWEAVAFYERKSMLLNQLKDDRKPINQNTQRKVPIVESRRPFCQVEKRPVEADCSTAENSDIDNDQVEEMVAALSGTRLVDSDDE